MKNSRLLAVFLVLFVELLGFGLILPLLPFYADSYGAIPFVVGLLAASYAAAQLLGASLIGRLSDRHGRRPIFWASIFVWRRLFINPDPPLPTWSTSLSGEANI